LQAYLFSSSKAGPPKVLSSYDLYLQGSDNHHSKISSGKAQGYVIFSIVMGKAHHPDFFGQHLRTNHIMVI